MQRPLRSSVYSVIVLLLALGCSSKGPTGERGAQGLQGADGPTGDTGLQGLQGIQGIQGTKGDQGPKGDPGPYVPTCATGQLVHAAATGWECADLCLAKETVPIATMPKTFVVGVTISNLQTDSKNCGTCNTKCGVGTWCEQGSCVPIPCEQTNSCPDGWPCSTGEVCQGGLCDGDVCASPAPSCTDRIQNQNESDVDCGGVCSPCATGRHCLVHADCLSGTCSAFGDCQ
jgi:collagen triple helix repeat protein/stigma-specific protein Stig1